MDIKEKKENFEKIKEYFNNYSYEELLKILSYSYTQINKLCKKSNNKFEKVE